MLVPGAALWPLNQLTPYARNARTHSAEQVAQIATSIDQFGFVGAIVVRGGTIAKGHGTLEAVRLLYDQGRAVYPAPGKAAGATAFPERAVPVLDVAGWSDAQFRAFVLADNRLALNAGWDEDMLAAELDALRDVGFDLPLIGFGAQELNDLIGTPNTGPPPAAGGIDYQEKFAVLVECGGEAHQAEVYERLVGQGFNCKVLVN